MKIVPILLLTLALLGAAVAATHFPVNFAVVFSIGCAAAIVALFAHDYRRERRRFQLRPHRSPDARPALKRTVKIPTASTLRHQTVGCS